MDQANYGAIAQMQDRNWWYQSRRSMFRALLSGRRFTNAADLGAGMGANHAVLSSVADQTLAVDPEAASVEACRAAGYSEVRQSSLEQLDLSDHSIDLALLADVLEHVDDIKAISELRRVLKDGGTAIISVPAFMRLWNWNDDFSRHLRRYSKKELKTKLENAGFEIELISYWNALFVLPVYLVSKIQRFRTKPAQLQNNLSMVPTFLNRLLVFWMSFETQIMRRYGLPFGVSVVAVVRKPSSDHASAET